MRAEPLPQDRPRRGGDRRFVRRPLPRGAHRRRPRRSFSISMPRTTRCTGTRKVASSTVITTATATCRCTSSVAGTCSRRSCGARTSMPQPAPSTEVARIVGQIRARWLRVAIVLRADSGFARDELMAWCEANGVDYVFGLARNERLVAEIAAELDAAAGREPGPRQPRRGASPSWRGARSTAGAGRAESSPRPSTCPGRQSHASS